MKKMLFAGALMIGIITLVRAGTPIDQAGQVNQGPYSNTTIWTSTNPASGTSGAVIIPAITKVSGSTTYSGRNCLTRILLQLSIGTTAYILDGGTTNYYIYGSGLGTTGTNTLNLVEDHLGPLCATAGNSMTVNLPAPVAATGANVANVEGFTFFPYSANSGQ